MRLRIVPDFGELKQNANNMRKRKQACNIKISCHYHYYFKAIMQTIDRTINILKNIMSEVKYVHAVH